jgi:hypothetical protein
LDYTQTADGTLNQQSVVPYSFVGYQTVSDLSSGDQLAYNQGVKGEVSSCYEVYVEQPKTGVATVQAEFATNDNYIIKTLKSTDTNNLQRVCVGPSTKTNPGFAVKNLNSDQDNTILEVYQDNLTW